MNEKEACAQLQLIREFLARIGERFAVMGCSLRLAPHRPFVRIAMGVGLLLLAQIGAESKH
jgi:hypothetical protein